MVLRRCGFNGCMNPVGEKSGAVRCHLHLSAVESGGAAGSAKAVSLGKATHAAVAAAGQRVPDSIDWDDLTPGRAQAAVEAVTETLDDPAMVWRNFDLLSNAMRSSNGPTIVSAVWNKDVIGSLRDAWLTLHGQDPKHPDSSTYRTLEGDDGYAAYIEAYKGFVVARNAAVKLSRRNLGPSPLPTSLGSNSSHSGSESSWPDYAAGASARSAEALAAMTGRKKSRGLYGLIERFAIGTR